MSAAAALHKREVVVDRNGRATVTVTLTDVEFDGKLVLATLAPPFTGVEFEPCAKADHGKRIRVEQEITRRGARIAAVRAQPVSRFKSLTWKFKATNAYPFTARDLVVPSSSFYQDGADGHVGRSCVLRIASSTLVLTLRFECEEAVFIPDNVRALVEEEEEKWHGIGHRWAPVKDPQPEVVTSHDKVFSVTFDRPVVGRRYAIACFPKPAESRAVAGKEWGDAINLVGDVVGTRNRLEPNAMGLRESLRQGLLAEMEQQYDASERAMSCTIGGFLWNPDERSLQAVYGQFPPGHWGAEFKYGEGVAGHSFRFDAVATYHHRRNNTLIYRRRDQADYEWVVCIPLRLGGTCIGVVSFSGIGQPDDPVSTELRALAGACPPFDPKQLDEFEILTWRLNTSFLNALANSQVLAAAMRKRVGELLEVASRSPPGAALPAQQVDATDELSEPTAPRDSAPASRPSRPRANTPRPRSNTPIGPSLNPVVAGPPSGVPGKQADPAEKRQRSALLKAVIPVLGTVAVAAIGLAGKVIGGKNDKAAESSHATLPTPPSTPVSPPATSAAPPNRASVLGLLDGSEVGLQELAKVEGEASAVDLNGANLSERVLRGATLRGFKLEGCDFTKSNLSTAWLDGARLVSAQMDHCILQGTHLSRVDLSGAVLRHADLTRATLVGARLAGAVLINADLTGASVGGADLTGADLTDANLTGVDLRTARGLNQKQLRCACSDGSTRVPSGLQVPKRCQPGR